LTIFLISYADYTLSVEGDATLSLRPTRDRFMRLYGAEWTDEAKARGTGCATINMVHPAHAEPYRLELKMGEFSHQSDAPAPTDDQSEDPRHQLGRKMMLLHELAHEFFASRPRPRIIGVAPRSRPQAGQSW
jgi:hypothetical protein